jgi:hypothetical protein
VQHVANQLSRDVKDWLNRATKALSPFSQLTKPFVNVARWSAEPLATLQPDRLGSAERLIELRLCKDAVTANTSSEPRAEGFLVSERPVLHRTKLGREKLGISAADTENDE